MNDVVKNLVLWIVIAVVLLSVFHSFGDRSNSSQTLIYSDFLTQVKQGQVREVTIEGQNITGKMIGTNAWLNVLMTSCLLEIIRATYVIKANLAKSEVWNVCPTNGISIHLLALLNSTPNNTVYNSNGSVRTSIIGAHLLNFVYVVCAQ